MASHYEAPIRKPLVTGNKTYHQISVDVAKPIEGKANKQWWIVFSISLVLFMWGVGCMIYTISTGIFHHLRATISNDDPSYQTTTSECFDNCRIS